MTAPLPRPPNPCQAGWCSQPEAGEALAGGGRGSTAVARLASVPPEPGRGPSGLGLRFPRPPSLWPRPAERPRRVAITHRGARAAGPESVRFRRGPPEPGGGGYRGRETGARQNFPPGRGRHHEGGRRAQELLHGGQEQDNHQDEGVRLSLVPGHVPAGQAHGGSPRQREGRHGLRREGPQGRQGQGVHHPPEPAEAAGQAAHGPSVQEAETPPLPAEVQPGPSQQHRLRPPGHPRRALERRGWPGGAEPGQEGPHRVLRPDCRAQRGHAAGGCGGECPPNPPHQRPRAAGTPGGGEAPGRPGSCRRPAR